MSLLKFLVTKTIPLLSVLSAACVVKTTKPNIIMFIADDLGWNDLSLHGSPQIPTPNIDYLAKSGIILNNYYVCSLCTPSRGSLMTGLYPIHTGLQHYVIGADEPFGLPLSHHLLPQYLKHLGYATHAVGKWHLGFFRKEYTPTFRGFDSHYGYWTGTEDYFSHKSQKKEMIGYDFRENMDPIRHADGKYSTHLYTKRALKIIREHDNSRPLFLYLAYQAVHSGNSYDPLQAPIEYLDRFPHIKHEKRRVFAGMLSAMDDSVGVVMKQLEDQNMLQNSIIIFTNDNGGPAAGFHNNVASNWPLRGIKHTLWEGGVRGTACIWSPLLPLMGRVSMDLMHITDWLPTLFYAAGGNISELGTIDGHNMWPTLSLQQRSPRIEVLHNIDPIDNSSALLFGKYKVVQGNTYDGQWDGWYGPSGREDGYDDFESFFKDYSRSSAAPFEIRCGPVPKSARTSCQPKIYPCLFDVVNDPCEYHNLADEKPGILAFMLERLLFHNRTAIQPENKPGDPKSDPKYHNGFWTTWMD